VGLYVADNFLARQEQTELRREAQDHSMTGRNLLDQGKAEQAVTEFTRAHTLQRSNREYRLALGEAQLAARDFPAAAATTDELLEENSNEGRANLLMARVLVAQNRLDDADAYYHRAIYGTWPSEAANEPHRVRLELARMLARRGNNRELLSELLLLQNAPALDVSTRKLIATLLLQTGSAERAADAYRAILRENAGDVEAHLSLAQAEVLMGNYRSAENAVMAALRREPYNENIQAEFRRVVKLASLDPTVRHISSAEKLRRAQAILKLVQEETAGCGSTAQTSTKQDAEAILDEAESLWKQAPESCRRPANAEDPLPLLLKKLS
jgi:tetratricopeptide (TPR) repeat protein